MPKAKSQGKDLSAAELNRKEVFYSTVRLSLRAGLAIVLCAGLSAAALAQEQTQPDAVAQANNPLANVKAFNVHDYYIGELTDTGSYANQFWLRYALPFSIGEANWLMRASLPVMTNPSPPNMDHETGLGDFNAFAAYLIDVGNPAISFGVGPLINAPTATDDALGSGKWSLGLANVAFVATNPKFLYGYLLTWQASVAGEGDRADVNIAAFQPLLIGQLGGGTYWRSTGIMNYDFENDGYNVPIGIGIGHVWKAGKTTYNVFVEPQWSVASKGAGWPEWQVFVGLNMLFK
jgi:hypothetical protein